MWQFTLKDGVTKKKRSLLPEIALFNQDGSPVDLGSSSDSAGSGIAVGEVVHRTDLGDHVLADGDELTPLTVDKPFIVQANFTHHATPSKLEMASYSGYAGAELYTGGPDGLNYSLSVILAPNETYYVTTNGGDATLNSVFERALA